MIGFIELKESFKKAGLTIFESLSLLEFDESREVLFKSLDVLIDFATTNEIKSIFYYYLYLDREYFLIDDSVFADMRLDDESISAIQKRVNSYNKKLHLVDYSKPYALYTGCFYNGFLFSYSEMEYWFLEHGLDFPENMVKQMIFDNSSEIQTQRENAIRKIEQERQLLKNEILNDPDFHTCTNNALRREYGKKIFSNGKHTKLFYNGTRWYDITQGEFIENIWREYKNSKKIR